MIETLPSAGTKIAGYDTTWGIDRTGTVIDSFVIPSGPYRGRVCALVNITAGGVEIVAKIVVL